MEGGGGLGGSFPYGNYCQGDHHLRLPLLKPRPPLTAIDRFLCGQRHFSQLEILANFKNKATLVPVNSDFVSSSSGGAIHGHAGGGGLLSWPITLPPSRDASSSVNGVLCNKESTPNLSPEMNPNVGLEKEEDLPRVPRGTGRRGKGDPSVALIKGQWTEEEDNTLRKLVKHFGVKKWAQIAEKMVGRAGKQCRERWHNHLRPDIKKDAWSQEEEKLLVEAHIEVGNRWAEIGKRIPGRTENSIKNHWNATRRRQNSKKKFKKPEGVHNGRNQSTILQEYIKSTCFNDDSLINISTGPSSTTMIPVNSASTQITPSNSVISEDPTSAHFNMLYPELSQSASGDSSSYLAQHSYDDEMNFMQNLFGSYNLNVSTSCKNDKGKAPLDIGINQKDKCSASFNSSGYNSTNSNNQDFGGNLDYGFFPSFAEPSLPTRTYLGDQESNQPIRMYSDAYLSHILDGGNVLCALPEVYPSNMNMEKMMIDQASPSVGKEVDLIEMISNSQFARKNATNNFVF
nr:transcription factor MYB64-like [Coffea arabica]